MGNVVFPRRVGIEGYDRLSRCFESGKILFG